MKTTAPKLNVRLLRRIQKHILEEPRRLKMIMWDDKENTDRPGKLAPPCGTAACIAGWAMILSGKKYRWTAAPGAKKLLGTRGHFDTFGSQTATLFDPEQWPAPFANKYNLDIEDAFGDATPTLAKLKRNAKIAAARIEHLITTGE